MHFSGSAYRAIHFKGLLRCLIYTSHLTPGWLKLGEGNLILCIQIPLTCHTAPLKYRSDIFKPGSHLEPSGRSDGRERRCSFPDPCACRSRFQGPLLPSAWENRYSEAPRVGKWSWLNKRIKSIVCPMNAYLRKASHPKARENTGVELCHSLASS